MAESEGGSNNPIIGIISTIFSFVGEIIGAFFAVLPKAISFILWAALALIILPCVWVAGEFYPKWVEWGEDF